MPRNSVYGYKVRPISSREEQFVIGLPRTMAQAVRDKRFIPEFTDEGILFRVVALPDQGEVPVELPNWVKGKSSPRSGSRT